MNEKVPGSESGQKLYRIEIRGRLDRKWLDWLNGIQIEYRPDTTILTSMVIDQTGLRGILGKLWDLNLTVISVTCTSPTSDDID
jgi:hypothetical protein